MGCYHPISAFQPKPGARIFLGRLGRDNQNLVIPCAKCIGCRTDKAFQWGQRAAHEASSYQHNSFVTLTYDDEHLPDEGHLVPAHLTNFLKRLRTHRDRHHGIIDGDPHHNIRHLSCGEYGERLHRPHYHTFLFNCTFNDHYQVTEDLYESPTLSALWPYGQARFGPATARAATYIAKYTLKNSKRIAGGQTDQYGAWRPAPFLRMSLKPAIGSAWLAQYATDLRNGYLEHDTRTTKVPRTYLAKLKQQNPDLYEEIRDRQNQYRQRESDNTQPERLSDAEKIHHARASLARTRLGDYK